VSPRGVPALSYEDERRDAVFGALADRNRRTILELLRQEGEMCVNDISDALFYISRPAVSRHLRVMREAELLRDRSSGRERWFSINETMLQQAVDWVQYYQSYWHDKLGELAKLAEEK
jgi:DNA-binding transcriptional ArsR family regulator